MSPQGTVSPSSPPLSSSSPDVSGVVFLLIFPPLYLPFVSSPSSLAILSISALFRISVLIVIYFVWSLSSNGMADQSCGFLLFLITWYLVTFSAWFSTAFSLLLLSVLSLVVVVVRYLWEVYWFSVLSANWAYFCFWEHRVNMVLLHFKRINGMLPDNTCRPTQCQKVTI